MSIKAAAVTAALVCVMLATTVMAAEGVEGLHDPGPLRFPSGRALLRDRRLDGDQGAAAHRLCPKHLDHTLGRRAGAVDIA